jgi:hypothetical protein
MEASGAVAYGLSISGANVYVAGSEFNGTYEVAKVWKNGTPISLSDGTRYAYATAIGLSGADVYLAGYDGNTAKVWKNGVSTSLTDGTNFVEVLGIFIQVH